MARTTAIQKTQQRLRARMLHTRISNRTVRKPITVKGDVIAPNLVQVGGTYYDAESAGTPGSVVSLVNVGRPSRAIYRPEGGIAGAAKTAGGLVAVGGGSGGGTTIPGAGIDHSTLLNLSADDHPHYLTATRGDSLYYRRSFIDAHIADANAHHYQQHALDSNADHTLADAAPFTFVGSDETGATLQRHIASADAFTNPSALLKAANGAVTLDQLTTQTQIITPQITSPENNFLDLDPVQDIRTAATMRSYNWFSGLTGAGINWTTGKADFRQITADEMFVDAFTALVTKALVGANIITKSMSRLAKAYTIKPTGQHAPLQVWDVPGLAGMPLFEEGDEVMLPYFQIGDITPGTPDQTTHQDTTEAGGAGTPGGSDTYVDQDFSSFTPGQTPADWIQTATGNSMAAGPDYWTVNADGAWQSNEGGNNYHAHWIGTGYDAITNYRYSGRFRSAAAGQGIGLTFFSDYPSSDTYYRLRRYAGAPTFHMSPHGPTTGPNGGTTSSTYDPDAYAQDTWHNFKIEVENTGTQTLIRARFWHESEAEPATWQINCYDSTANRYTAGTAGLWGYTNTPGIEYDDLLVESLTASGGTDTILTVARPSGTAAGDLLVLAVTHDSTAAVSAAGFSPLENGTQNGKRLTLFTKIAGSSEPATYSVILGTADDAAATITALRNIDNAPIAGTQIKAGNAASVNVGGSLTPARDNSLQLVVVATMNDTTAGSASGMTLGGDTLALSTESRLRIYYAGNIDTGANTPVRTVTWAAAEDYITAELLITSSLAGSGGGSVAIGRAWVTVEEYAPGTEPETLIEGAQLWKATVAVDTSAAGYTILPDAPALDYGQDGDGVVEMSAVDPNGAPYIRAFYRGLHAWDTSQYEVVFQAGNIDGTPAIGTDGVYIAQRPSQVTPGEIASSIEISDAGQIMNNVGLRQQIGAGPYRTVAWLEETRARFGYGVTTGLTALEIDYNTGNVTIGRTGAGSYARWDEANDKLTVRGTLEILAGSTGLDNIADGTTYGKVNKTILNAGWIQVGSGTKDSTLDGWNIGLGSEIVGQLDGVDQVVLNLQGEITAGIGRVHLNRDGLGLDVSSGMLTSRRVSFNYSGTESAYLAATVDTLTSGWPGRIVLAAAGANGGDGEAWLYGYGASDNPGNFAPGAPPAYGSALGATPGAVKVQKRGLLIDEDSLHATTIPAGQLRITDDFNTWGAIEADPAIGALLFQTQSANPGPFGGGYVLLGQTQSTNPTTPSGYGAIYFGGAGNALLVKYPNGTIKAINVS